MALRRVLPAASKGDAMSVHHARIATRRLREALPLVASGRTADRLGRDVRRLTRVLGPVRELDVALEILNDVEATANAPRPAIQRLRGAIAEERRLLHAEMRRRLGKFDVSKLREHAVAAARRQAGRTPKRMRDPKQAAGAKARVARRSERLAATIENAAGLYLPDRLHDVRIAVKKLRYTLELAQAFSGSRATARMRALKSAQDLLGRMRDLEVLIARSRSIQSSPGASNLKVSADLDRLVRRLETDCRQLHGQYVASRRDLLSLCDRLIAAGRIDASARTSAA